MLYSSGVTDLAHHPVPAADADLLLLQRIAARDQDALQALYDRHASALLHYLTGRLGDARLAEEVLQDAMLAVWQGAGRFRGECRVRTWLLTIARNRAINAYHRQVAPRSRDVPFEGNLPGAERLVAATDAYPDLENALLCLPDEQRETLELVFYHGLSLQETAQVLQVPQGTVKSRLHRAKARLRALMEAESDPDERTY